MDIRIAWAALVALFLFTFSDSAIAKAEEDVTESAHNAGAPPLMAPPEPGKSLLMIELLISKRRKIGSGTG